MSDAPVADGRRRRGLETRSRIARAAVPLFAENGFDGVTITAIARSAGVSEPSVYYAFGSKEAILAATIDLAVAGDEEPVATLERAWARAALADPRPEGQLRRQVDGAGQILLRAGPLLEVLRGAAGSNATLAELWAENVRRRRQVQNAFVSALVTKSPLRHGLSKNRATDVSTLLLGPESYVFLTASMGWRHQTWRTWTREALVRELL